MYDVLILDNAWKDIDKIADLYLNLSGPKSAKRITDKILDTVESLKMFPYGYPLLRDEELREQGYRMAVVKHYLVIYRIFDNTVYVYHVADGRTDYPQLMK